MSKIYYYVVESPTKKGWRISDVHPLTVPSNLEDSIVTFVTEIDVAVAEQIMKNHGKEVK